MARQSELQTVIDALTAQRDQIDATLKMLTAAKVSAKHSAKPRTVKPKPINQEG